MPAETLTAASPSLPLFALLVAVALLAHYFIERWLLNRHLACVAAHRDEVPPAFAAEISLSEHQRAADYTQAKGALGRVEAGVGLVVSALILFGGLSRLWGATAPLADSPILREVALVALLSAITGLIGIPFGYYSTFFIEEKFGFNKSTRATFWADLVKGTLLSATLLLPLAALVFWLMRSAGTLWWLYAWAVFVGFQLLMLAIYPTFIAPLFNKFTPLGEGDTKAAIEGLLQRTDFTSNGLFVMDGSRRSAHGNAYFTGFGAAKRIVFFDTLLARLSNREIVAVLAHELGHFKRKHIVKRIVFMAVASLAFLAAVAWLMPQPWLYTAFTFPADTGQRSPGVALILFSLVLPPLLFWLTPLAAAYSRKHEFEADAYAADVANRADLVAALTKLYKDNASTLTPDPLYSAWHHSHPPATIRIAHLESLPSQGASHA
ncbi:MAG: M48 family metallopeptidase [Burkholderiales bacterium]|nr:M48 family metallopeptidase [Burkholderiales bacterium]